MRRTEYQNSIYVYSQYKSGFVIWKWNFEKGKYETKEFKMIFKNIANIPVVNFKVSPKDNIMEVFK
jgi:hypothetical protein